VSTCQALAASEALLMKRIPATVAGVLAGNWSLTDVASLLD
jgi:hypothetical protein